MSELEKIIVIRALNDALRTNPGKGWVMTTGVAALGPAAIAEAVAQVVAYDRFDQREDPNDRHDFGVVDGQGCDVLWRIDCYDLNGKRASADPANPNVTRRVLTLLEPDEL